MGLRILLVIMALISLVLTSWIMNNENWDTQYEKFIPKVDAKYLQDIELEKQYKSGLRNETNIRQRNH